MSIYNSLTRLSFSHLQCFALISCCSIFNDRAALLADSLTIISQPFPFVNTFFEVFSIFLTQNRLRRSLLGGEFLYFTTKPRKSQYSFEIFLVLQLILSSFFEKLFAFQYISEIPIDTYRNIQISLLTFLPQLL